MKRFLKITDYKEQKMIVCFLNKITGEKGEFECVSHCPIDNDKIKTWIKGAEDEKEEN